MNWWDMVLGTDHDYASIARLSVPRDQTGKRANRKPTNDEIRGYLVRATAHMNEDERTTAYESLCARMGVNPKGGIA